MQKNHDSCLIDKKTTVVFYSWLGWVLLSCVFLIFQAFCARLIYFETHDGYQYLSVAKNLLNGNGLSTSIIHFDEQFRSGKIPTPQTVWPPGYPILMAAIGYFDVPLQYAGYAISLVSFWILLLLILISTRMLEFTPGATRTVLILCIANSTCWVFAVSIQTESLFSVLVLSAILIIAYAESKSWTPSSYAGLLVCGSLLAAATYWIRYAGLFLIASIGLYYLGDLCLRRNRRALFALLVFGGITTALTLMGFLRNQVLSGSWTGGSYKPANNSIFNTLYNFIAGAIQVAIGYFWMPKQLIPLTPLKVLVLLIPIAVVFLILLLFAIYFQRYRFWFLVNLKRPLPLLVLCFLVTYLCFLLYIGKHTSVSLGARMIGQAIPAMALLVGCLYPRESQSDAMKPPSVYLKTILFVTLIGYISSHLLVHTQYLSSHQKDNPSIAIRDWLSTSVEGEKTISDWIEQNISPDETIIAIDGQATGYVLKRKTVSICSHLFSRYRWDEKRFSQVARTYGVRYFIFFPRSGTVQFIIKESPFIADILEDRLPTWMSVAVKSNECRIISLNPQL